MGWMLDGATRCFVFAAVIGIVPAARRFRDKPLTWSPPAGHSVFGGLGTTLMGIAVFTRPAGLPVKLSFALFVLTAPGGSFPGVLHAREKPLPKVLIIGHALPVIAHHGGPSSYQAQEGHPTGL